MNSIIDLKSSDRISIPVAPRPRQDSNLLFLDGLRGLAAFYVMVGHARWLLWEGYSEGFVKHPESYSALNKALVYFFSLFKFGHEAVLFFFVLSGFVIHLRYANDIRQKGTNVQFDWWHFVCRRARRLYPPLFTAIALAFLLVKIGELKGFTIYNRGTIYPMINQNVWANLDGVTLLGNLGFLMNSYVPVYGGNGPLWSLKFEWWFYMMYPVFWWFSRRSIFLASGLMIALFALSFHQDWWPLILLRDVFSGMLSWWLGVLIADIFTKRLHWRWKPVIIVALVFGILMLMFPGLHDMGVALIFSSLLGFCFFLKEMRFALKGLGKIKPLGDMSYTLYVTHFPILVFGSGWLMKRSRGGELPRHFGWVVCGVILTLIAAYSLHFLAERPFVNQRRSS